MFKGGYGGRTVIPARGRRRGLAALAVALSVLLALGPAAVTAQPGADLIDRSRARPDPGGDVDRPEVTLRQAIALAQRENPGRVVRAEPKSQNGRRVYEIRILGEDGKVKTVRIDADGTRR